MPIMGLTDKNSYNPTRSMSLVAKIKKGTPKTNGRMGQDTDHFRFDMQPNFTKYESVLHELYGDQPKKFDDVIFNTDSPHIAFDSWYEKWGAGQDIKIRCDGQMIHKHQTKDFTDSYQPIPCRNSPDKSCGCKQVGRLAFILSKFSMKTGVYGYFLMETHSIYDIGSIFQALMGVSEQFGSIRNVQWVLERVPKEINTPKQDNNGNITGRIKTTKHLVNIRPSEDSIKRYILPKLQEQQLLGETVADTTHMLASVNETDIEPIDLDDDEIETEQIDLDSFTHFVQKVYPDATIDDIASALDGYTVTEREQAIAIFCDYWSGLDRRTALDCIELLCKQHPSLSCDDAKFIYDEMFVNG